MYSVDQVHDYPEREPHYGPTVIDEMTVAIGGVVKNYSERIALPASVDEFSEIISSEINKFRSKTENLRVFLDSAYGDSDRLRAVSMALGILGGAGILKRGKAGISFDSEKLERSFNKHSFVFNSIQQEQLEQFSVKLAKRLKPKA